MATSESDDFESADEEIEMRRAPPRRTSFQRLPSTVDSESDDDGECAQHVGAPFGGSWSTGVESGSAATAAARPARLPINARPDGADGENTATTEKIADGPRSGGTKQTRTNSDDERSVVPGIGIQSVEDAASASGAQESAARDDRVSETSLDAPEGPAKKINGDEAVAGKSSAPEPEPAEAPPDGSGGCELPKPDAEPIGGRRERPRKQAKPREPRQVGAKKLGSKIVSGPIAGPSPIDAGSPEESRKKATAEARKPPLIEECWEGIDAPATSGEPIPGKMAKPPSPPKWDGSWDDPVKPSNVDECWEDIDGGIEMPEELKSNKKFREVFQFDGWEGAEDEVEIPEELTERTILPVLEKLSSVGQEQADKSGGWGWGGWGVSSLLNTATAGVSTLTSHVSHGLTMLEETIGAPDPEELANAETREESEATEVEPEEVQKVQSQPSFGFGNLMSGVSSLTNFVESTSTKVISGGLDTLETIGKKTMEVLQEGDPGLKKKRAFFLNESDKPILSQMLREAKESAEVEEKTLEERQLARKVHFESLFDDYQGLVHLEALEMLSKQCTMRIQQRMIDLDGEELTSLQETLGEVKELCDLGDEEDEEESDKDLKERLKDACKDLGVNITHDKLLDTWEEVRSYLSKISPAEADPSEREVFQRAIATLAQFTAFSVERFHKTAELLLIKERRSTVNEADSLVQLAQILSGQIGVVANSFSGKLNEMSKTSEKPEVVSSHITNIFLEAANASSYVLEAFRLLIPVLQVGAT